MFKACILLFVLLISSCTSTKKQMDVVYPTISNEQKKKIEKQTSIPVVKESTIDLSEGSTVVFYKKPVSLEEQNRSLNWKLYQKEKEVENLKKIIEVTENDYQESPKLETVNSTLSNTTSKEILATESKMIKNISVETVAKTTSSSQLQPISEQTIADPTAQIMEESVSEQGLEAEEKITSEVVKEEASLLHYQTADKKYCLRIISLPMHDMYEKSVENIVLFLKTENINATYYALGKYWVVDVVNVPPYRSPQSIEFQEKVKKLKYQGSFQFKDAYYTVSKNTSQK